MVRTNMLAIAKAAKLENGTEYGRDVNTGVFWIQQTPDVLSRFQNALENIISTHE